MSDQHTTVIPRVDPAPVADPPAEGAGVDAAGKKPSRIRSLAASRIVGSSTSAVWAGLVVAAFGFGLIFFSWIKVAATLDVGRQMPYVVSGGMTGLGMIVVGIALVDMAVRRQDRIERRHQLSLMRTLLEELREVVEPGEHRDSR